MYPYYPGGQAAYAFLAETASMWGIRILPTFFCVKVWELDLQAVWCCMIADNICKALLFALPFFSRRGRERLFSQAIPK